VPHQDVPQPKKGSGQGRGVGKGVVGSCPKEVV